MEYFKSNLWEIRKSLALTYLGAVLALAHILTYANWLSEGSAPLKYFAQSTPMCWSLWESCQWVRFLPMAAMEILFQTYVVLAGISLALFLITRMVGLAWFVLMLAFSLNVLFYFQDFRLSSNEQYLLIILNFCFLFIPNKKTLTKFLIISYSVCSGLLKLYPQWMTGNWFEERMTIHIKLGEWLAAVGYLVETIAPAALLFRDARYFLSGLAAMIAYQVFLWTTSSFYSPVLMLALLSYFIAIVIEDRKTETEFVYQSYIRPEPSKMWVITVLFVFWLAQAMPILPLQNPILNRLGHILSLDHMAATSECRISTHLIFKNHIEEVSLENRSENNCDAYMRFLELKSICADKSSDPNFQTVFGSMQVRGIKDVKFKTAFEISDFCSASVSFHSLGANTSGL